MLTCFVLLGCAGSLAYPARIASLDTHSALSGCFRYSVRTDQASYQPGQSVRILVTATNVNTHACLGRGCGGVTPSFEVFDAAGRSVYVDAGAGVMCVADPPPRALIRPGRTEEWSDGGWDQRGPWTGRCSPGGCHSSRAQAPAGLYRITWRWVEAVAPTNWFALGA